MPRNVRQARAGSATSWRQSLGYRLLLYVLILLLLAGIWLLLRSPGGPAWFAPAPTTFPPSSSTVAPAPEGAPAVLEAPGEADTRSPDAVIGSAARERAGQDATGSAGGGGTGRGADDAAQTRAGVEALRQRLEALSGGETPQAMDDLSGSEATAADVSPAPKGEAGADVATGAERYSVELPPYDREAFAERQRQLEALRARTLSDLQSVSPADAEGMLEVIRRMSEGIREQGLPEIVDMPKMEAMLLGSKRLNELNTALVAELGRGAAARPEEMARLAKEIEAVQATIPSTVYDLEAVGKLMRGELP